MPTESDREIRARAYELWVEGGQRSDTSDADWLRAEAELRARSEPPETAAPSIANEPSRTASGEAQLKPAKASRASPKMKTAEVAGSPPSSMPKPAPRTGGAKIEGATKVATKRAAKTAGE